MTDDQLSSLPEFVPPTLDPSSHPRGGTVHPQSQSARTTSDDHLPPIHETVRLTQTSSSHTRPTTGQSSSLHTSSPPAGVAQPLSSGFFIYLFNYIL